MQNIEIRLHRTVLYNSIYLADGQFVINQHADGIPVAQAPTFCLCDPGGGEMAALYLDSFERVWASAAQLHSVADQRTAVGKGDDSADVVVR